jgi:putative thiamine transport system permease protein
MSVGQSLYRWGITLAPWLLLGLLILPVVGGLAGVALPAFGWLPALGGEQFSLNAWQQLWQQPGLLNMLQLSALTGLLSTVLALCATLLLLASLYASNALNGLLRLFSPLLVIPHASAAIAIAFLLTPSGLFSRVFASSGILGQQSWTSPPDWFLPNDAAGLSIVLALALKELPFLMVMALAALTNTNLQSQFRLAQSLGYQRVTAFFKVVLPQLYPKLRLPLYAVLVYGCSNVEVALILGPSGPPTLAVAIVQWFNDVDLDMRFMASAGALLQLTLVLVIIGCWWVVEVTFSRLSRNWLSNGQRSYGDKYWQYLGGLLLIAMTLIMLLGLGGLVLWSVAGYWFYPDLLPQSMQLQHWQNALLFIRLPVLNAVLVAVASTALAIMLSLATLEAEQQRQRQLTWLGNQLSWLGQTVIYLPLIVPAVAFLFGVVWLQQQLTIQPGMASVIASHTVFVLPYVFLALAGNYRYLDPRWAKVGAGLGLSPAAVFIKLKLPLLFAPIMLAIALGLAVSFAQYLPTLLTGGGRVPTLTTEAVALANGGSRRLIAVYALLQMLLPALGFIIAYWCSVVFFNAKPDAASNKSGDRVKG